MRGLWIVGLLGIAFLGIDPVVGAQEEVPDLEPGERSEAFFGVRSPEERAALLEREGGGATEAAVALGLDWLAGHQGEGGLWDADDFSSSCGEERCTGDGGAWCDTGLTGLALMAFLSAGHTASEGDHREAVARAIDALQQGQDAEGCFGTRTGHFLYNHAMATLAMVEVHGMTGEEDSRESAQRAIDFLVAAQNPGRAWRYGVRPGDNDTSVTGWAVMALACARQAGLQVPGDAFQGALIWLDAATDDRSFRTGYLQRGDRGARLQSQVNKFISVESCSAISLLSRILMGAERNDPIVRGQVDLLSRRLPAWVVQDGPGQKSQIDFYYWYYGSLAIFQVGAAPWRAWNRAMKQALVPNQCKEGHERGSWDPVGAWGGESGRIGTTALAVLSLEVYYRYPREGE